MARRRLGRPLANLFFIGIKQGELSGKLRRVKKTRLSKFKNVIGGRVRKARLAMRPAVSQEDLSGRLAREGITMTQASVSKLENRARYVMDYEAQALAKILKVGIAQLFGADQES